MTYSSISFHSVSVGSLKKVFTNVIVTETAKDKCRISRHRLLVDQIAINLDTTIVDKPINLLLRPTFYTIILASFEWEDLVALFLSELLRFLLKMPKCRGNISFHDLIYERVKLFCKIFYVD